MGTGYGMGAGSGEMSVGFAIGPIEIRELSATRTTEASRLRELAQIAEELAVLVENDWDSFSVQHQDELRALVYSIVAQHKGPGSKLRALRSAIRYARIRYHEDQDALFDFAIAQRRLINAILSAIERDNPDYRRALADAVESSMSEVREGKAETLTDENTGDWLRRISDEALK